MFRSIRKVSTTLSRQINPIKTAVEEGFETESTTKEIGKKVAMTIGYGAFWVGACVVDRRFPKKQDSDENQMLSEQRQYMPHGK